jgi:ethanolamine utilization protein EutQ (cupin superfamily)
VSGIEVFHLADAPFEAYAGPPGRIDVADVITTANSTTIAAGFVESEGGPFAYRCDYEAVCVPLDDTMTWETGTGSRATKAGDVIWIPHGGRASYRSTGVARFVYATFPVNWPEIVGWNPGEDIKDLSALGDVGKLEAVSLIQLADPRMPWMTARRSSGSQFEHAVVTRPGLGAAMTTIFIRTDAATGWNLGAGEGLILMLQGKARFGSEGMEASAGDLVWKPEDEPLRMETSGASLCVSVSAASGKPVNGPRAN